MKAAICTGYGDSGVLKIDDIKKPVPGTREILIKVHAATVTSGDIKLRSCKTKLWEQIVIRLVFGIKKPRKPVLGMEAAGVVEDIGRDVKLFKKGDRVIAYTGPRLGAHAEYLCIHENRIVAKIPDHLSFEEAATVPHGGTSALYFLRKSKIGPGKKILVYGASGAVGTFAVQLAGYYKANVTGVCSTSNLETVTALGADKVIDYTKVDFSEQRDRFDIVFDAVGKSSKKSCRKVLTKSGKYVTVGGFDAAAVRTEDVKLLTKLIGSGVIRPYIDRFYPLEQIAEAHAYVEEGHKTGNVVLQIE